MSLRSSFCVIILRSIQNKQIELLNGILEMSQSAKIMFKNFNNWKYFHLSKKRKGFNI